MKTKISLLLVLIALPASSQTIWRMFTTTNSPSVVSNIIKAMATNVVSENALPDTGTAGTYTKVTTDAKGRVSSGTSATLASSDFANQGTTTTVLHGNASGNPSFGAVNLSTDVTGTLPIGSVASLGTLWTNGMTFVGIASNQVYFYKAPPGNLGQTNFTTVFGDLVAGTNAITGMSWDVTNGTYFSSNGIPATVGVQQGATVFDVGGAGWKTTATAGSQPVRWVANMLPVQGSATPSVNLVFSNSINNAAFVESVRFDADGAIDVNAPVQNLIRLKLRGQIIADMNSSETEFGSSGIGFGTVNNPSGRKVKFLCVASGIEANNTIAGTYTNVLVKQIITSDGLSVASGSNKRAGNATLVSGTVTVNNTSVAASDLLFLTRKTAGGTIGIDFTYSLSAATSFTINAVDSAGAVVTTDTSVISWMLVGNP